MTTIIVHGTAAASEKWYWDSWHEGGFCYSLAHAIHLQSGFEDVWTVKGTPVSEVPELNPRWSALKGRIGQISQRNGHFIWSGDFAAISRKMSGNDFAKYLNAITRITNEPIRVVAHSHGCNVVKSASMSRKLDSKVYIDTAVFLACPHMTDSASGESLYPLNPSLFGRIGNFYSERDGVVKNMANKFATVSGRFDFEVPNSSFVDTDRRYAHIYDNFHMSAPSNLGGTAVHGWLHSQEMAYSIGKWMETGSI